MEKGLVSVITPCFNAAAFIEETINSVKAQHYSDWEMLIADDGSTDETAEIVAHLAADEPRIQFFSVGGESGLPARGRNCAMKRARGEYFALLDADDLWVPKKLARQIAYLRAHPEADGVCSWFETFGDPDRVRLEQFRMMTSPVCEPSESVGGVAFFPLTLVFRRECYEEGGGMDEDARLRGTEDAEFCVRLVMRYKIHRLRTVLAHYRLAPLANPSLSLTVMSEKNEKSWKLTAVLEEKGLLNKRDLRRRRSFLYYEEARFNLHLVHGPFRILLLKSVLAGRPSWQALVTLSLCFLPRSVLSRLLMSLMAIHNKGKQRRFGTD